MDSVAHIGVGSSEKRRTRMAVGKPCGLLTAALLCAGCGDGGPSGYGYVLFGGPGLSAWFVRHHDSVQPVAQVGSTGNGCKLWPSFAEVPEEKQEMLSAGTLTVNATGTWESPDNVLTIEPNTPDTFYTFGSLQVPEVFGARTKIRFSFSGATVPAFNGRIEVPLGIALVEPEVPSSVGGAEPAPVTIDRSSDLQISWAGGDPAAVAGFGIRDKEGRALACEFPVSAGSALIPASLVAQLAASEEADAQISVYSAKYKETAALSRQLGGWAILIGAADGESRSKALIR